MAARPRLRPGSPAPLGAHWDGGGVNFALFSRHAETVELCLFDSTGRREEIRLALPARDDDIWHGYLEGAGPGLTYGYRVHGPYQPDQGHRFNPNKLLLDPFARSLAGAFAWHESVFGYRGRDTASFDERDSAPHVPRCRVTAPLDLPGRPPRPRIPWADTVLYELHPRGFSQLHPDVPGTLRGTLGALAEPAIVEHLRGLGVTTLELLPVTAFIDELPLVKRGMRNYWGYNPIAFCAAHAPYLGGGGLEAFARTVDRLHEAGLEIVLDVVFNHTAESDERGPTLVFRGLDNAAYYHLDPERPGGYRDYTGCHNSLNAAEPAVVDLAHHALRFWAGEIGVDGFRFDLAATLARDAEGRFDADAPLLKRIATDPELSRLKLIAEPWDLGEPGHFLGAFPPPFAEWNDRYRDGMRRFWRGDGGQRGEFATRFAGSSDVFRGHGKSPAAGVNFITAHDGFTLADLTAYAGKHNEANGEDNRDGADQNWSSNGGVEGPSRDTAVLERRRRRCRALLATLLLSRGTPMLLAGDELSHTQGGNNNPYCQDTPLTWLDWSARGDAERDLAPLIARATGLRRRLALLRGAEFFSGESVAGPDGPPDVAWLAPEGGRLSSPEEWQAPERALGVLMTGCDGVGDSGPEQLYLALNPADTLRVFTLPLPLGAADWVVALDGSAPADPGAAAIHAGGGLLEVPPQTLLALVPSRPG